MLALSIDKEIPSEFFQEEIRDDYTISSTMKKVWAIELDLFMKFVDVCSKYDLKYFADSGTLIGAIRNKGFIPWDDDIDLVMFRDDYEKLKLVVQKELGYPYFFQTTYTDKGYIRGHAQLRNSLTTGFMEKEKDRPYNKGIFIDIFVLDSVPNNKVIRKVFFKIINELWMLLYFYNYLGESDLKKYGKRGFLYSLYYKLFDYKNTFRIYDYICSFFNRFQTNEVSYIAYSQGKEKHIWKREWFDLSYLVPFEFTYINVPSGYDLRLRKEYGNYLKPVSNPPSHGTLVLDPETPYK